MPTPPERFMNLISTSTLFLSSTDKLKKKEYAARLAAMPEELGNPAVPIIPFSAQNGLGVDEVKKMIEKSFNSQEDNE